MSLAQYDLITYYPPLPTHFKTVSLPGCHCLCFISYFSGQLKVLEFAFLSSIFPSYEKCVRSWGGSEVSGGDRCTLQLWSSFD